MQSKDERLLQGIASSKKAGVAAKVYGTVYRCGIGRWSTVLWGLLLFGVGVYG